MGSSHLVKVGEDYKKAVGKALRLVKDIEKYGEDREGHLVKLSRKLDDLGQLCAELDQQPGWAGAVETWLQAERQHNEDLIRRRQERLTSELAEEFSLHGLSLRGTVPLLRVEYFSLELNMEKNTAIIWFGPKQERLARGSLSIREVTKRVLALRSALGSDISKDVFLAKLNEAVDRWSGIHKLEGIPLISLMAELSFLVQPGKFLLDPRKENFQGYGRADFACDLFRWRKAVLDRYHLVVATRALTRSRKDFLWIPDSLEGSGTMYSHLSRNER